MGWHCAVQMMLLRTDGTVSDLLVNGIGIISFFDIICTPGDVHTRTNLQLLKQEKYSH